MVHKARSSEGSTTQEQLFWVLSVNLISISVAVPDKICTISTKITGS